MKFDKFGAFPKTEGVESQAKQLDLQSTFLNLLPMLFQKKETPTPDKEKTEVVKPRLSPDAIAYQEYLSRHDAFVKSSKENKKTPL